MSKIKNRGVKRKLEEQKLDISPVDLLLQKFPVFEEIPAREGWLICKLTKHEFPRSDIENYVKSKKFIWAFEIQQIINEFGEHFDLINPQLYGCKRTMKTVAKDPKDLKNHITGKAFIKALAKFKKEEAEKKQMELETEKTE